ncbi:MAG: serine/threonine protein kinase [Campylobacteraceae bacterium]|nr:serine/threonine protein kinase [Campylobacteraceae bacterium]
MSYTEIEKLGRGGFAEVVKVTDGNTEYAKKIFSPSQNLLDGVGIDELKRRFKREVKYQKSLTHRNILEILDVYLTEQPPYFIMPLADCTLEYELKHNMPDSPKIKIILFDILAGLEFLHLKGFKHRDLKPANVLKFSDNNEDRYAISDFGLISANESDSSTITATGQGAGTQNYSAPELINGGLKKATFKVDIYSFGAILHDIFASGSSRTPYSEIIFPGEIGIIMSKCTKTNPLRRYNSVSELREEIYDYLNTNIISFVSDFEESLVSLLKEKNNQGNPLTNDEWDRIFSYIDENPCAINIYKTISEEQILELHENPSLFNAMGEYFAEYIKNYSHDFAYCDILASKAEKFYDNGDLSLKSEIAITLLLLGTSHNRWYVEQKFMRMINTEISDILAERIKVELDVQDIDFISKMNHVCNSISITTDNMHPILENYLNELQ